MLKNKHNHKFVMITKPWTYIDQYVEFSNCTKFESFPLKNGLKNAQNMKVSDQVSIACTYLMSCKAHYQYHYQARWIISVKLKLIQQVVTRVESKMLTDRQIYDKP